jgi:hypothetical protein
MVVKIWSIILKYFIIAITITYFSLDFCTLLGNYSNQVGKIQIYITQIPILHIKSLTTSTSYS